MKPENPNRSRIMTSAIPIVALALALFWVLDSVMHAFLLQKDNFIQQLLAPELSEILYRSLGTLLIIAFAIHGQIRQRKQRQAEKALRESEAKFRTITSTANDAVIMLDNDGHVSYWNPAAEGIFGYTNQEVLGKDLHMLMAPQKYLEAYRKGFSAFRETGQGAAVGKTLELEAIRKNGTEFPIEISLSAIQVKGQWHAVGIARDITQRKQAEQALQESETRFQDIALSTSDWLWEVDAKGTYTFCSEKVENVLGYTPQEIIGKTPFDLMPPEEAEKIGRQFQEIAAAKAPIIDLENWNLHKDGHLVYLLTSGIPKIDVQGNLAGYRGADKDITERKRAEEELIQAKSIAELAQEMAEYSLIELNQIFNTAGTGMLVTDKNFGVMKINDVLAAMVGTDYSETEVLKCYDVLRCSLCRTANCPLTRIINGEERVEVETELERRDGTTVPCIMTATPYRMHGSELIGIVETFKDITERKRAEEALRESEAKFRTITSTAKDAIIMLNNDGNLSYWNPAAEEIFGYRSEEAIGKELHILIAPEKYLEAYRKGFSVFRETGQGAAVGKTLELEAIRKNGTEFPMEISLSAIQVKGRWHAVGIVRDITRRKRAEEALRESEAKYRSLIDNSRDAIYLLAGNKIELINPAFSEMFQVTLEETRAPDFNFMQMVAPRSQPLITERQRMQEQGENPPARYEFTAVRKDGKEIQLEASESQILYDGRVVIQGILRDITDRKKLEAQLLQVQKMEAIGQLAAGIAHEINTPIQYVGDNARFLKDAYSDMSELLTKYENLLSAVKSESLTDGIVQEIEAAMARVDVEYLKEEIPQAAEQALEGAGHVAKIVRAMKEFSHPGSKEKEPVNLNGALESTITIARNEWKYVAEMLMDFDPSLPLVPCVTGEMNQVFLNVIINATQAIADVVGDGSSSKGTIKVSTRRDGDWAEVRIADSGTGIPASIGNKIFDPFFTTKEVGKGTGQRLAIAHSTVVDKHHGIITFETVEGEGTTFIIRLPIKDKLVYERNK